MPAKTPKDVTIRKCVQILEEYLNSLPEDIRKKPPHKQAEKALRQLKSLVEATSKDIVSRFCGPKPIVY